jgi:hypothetical protein
VRLLSLAITGVVAPLPVPTQAQEAEPLDLQAITLIREEAMERSQIMEIAWFLTDHYGPRLTGSTNLRAAAEWARDRMTEWGLANTRLEAWGPFGPGWDNERFYAHVIEPQPYPLFGFPKPWTPGTRGLVRGGAIVAPIRSPDDFARFRGTLEGKFVLTDTPIPFLHDANPNPWPERHDNESLREFAKEPVAEPLPGDWRPDRLEQRFFAGTLGKFLVEEGAAAWLRPAPRWGNGGVMIADGWELVTLSPDSTPATVSLPSEQYGRIYRTLEHGVPVTLEMNVQNQWNYRDSTSFNVVAEIPGIDRADEVVIIGAHFDSHLTGTGAGDNAAGVALVMEAARILKTLSIPMRRTVRVILFSSEETLAPHGLGSHAYVHDHLFDFETGEPKPEHATVSAYFNLDWGCGRIRGVMGVTDDEVATIMKRWSEPFWDQGMTMVGHGLQVVTDDLPFRLAGIPAFYFLQDGIDSFGHTHLDTYETLVEDEFKQAAVVVASFVYHVANRDSLLPRRPIPREVELPVELLDRYAGEYEPAPGLRVLIERRGNRLVWRSLLTSIGVATPPSEFRPLSETEFFSFDVQVGGTTVSNPRIEFASSEAGRVNSLRCKTPYTYFDARKVR